MKNRETRLSYVNLQHYNHDFMQHINQHFKSRSLLCHNQTKLFRSDLHVSNDFFFKIQYSV